MIGTAGASVGTSIATPCGTHQIVHTGRKRLGKYCHTINVTASGDIIFFSLSSFRTEITAGERHAAAALEGTAAKG